MKNKLICFFLLLILSSTVSQVFAQSTGDSLVPFLTLSELSLLTDNNRGEYKAWRGFQALAATYVSVEAIKSVFPEIRPDGSDNDSFPSGHAALSFAAASVLDISQHDRAIPAYASAGIISWSRVKEDKHYWKDIIFGATLGYVIGKQFAVKDSPSTSLIQVGFSF